MNTITIILIGFIAYVIGRVIEFIIERRQHRETVNSMQEFINYLVDENNNLRKKK